MKIAANGVFGKLGSPWSILYAPHLMVAVTLTGQLALLMLIERAERMGISVVSANTDGVGHTGPARRCSKASTRPASPAAPPGS
jgi:DNA polymerase elongation subunit (family B)